MVGGVAHQGVDAAYQLAKIRLVRNTPPPIGIACRIAVLVVDVDEVDVARDIQLPRPQLAHAHNANLRACAMGRARLAVLHI